jgi:hypothetical protein
MSSLILPRLFMYLKELTLHILGHTNPKISFGATDFTKARNRECPSFMTTKCVTCNSSAGNFIAPFARMSAILFSSFDKF